MEQIFDHRPLSKEMFNNPVELKVSGDLDFLTAKELADKKAKELASKPMLLAWFDKNNGTFSPKVVCACGDKPSWLAYAQNREGDIEVNINDEEYVFVYRNCDF